MKPSKSQEGIGGIADILLVISNILFGLLTLYFLIIISAPLFGGVLLPITSYLPFAYLAGFYFVERYFLKNMRNKIELKNYQYWFIAIYHSSLVLGLPVPFNFIAFVLSLVFFMNQIKREIKSWTVGQDASS